MIWYKIRDKYWDKKLIVEVEVEKETEKYLIIDGIRHAKISQYDRFFPSLESAYNYLKRNLSKRIEKFQERIEKDKAKLEDLEKNYNPYQIKLPNRRKIKQ